MRKLVVCAAMAALFPLASWADILVLRNGGHRYGRFVSGSGNQIVFQDDNGSRNTYDVGQVQSIEFQSTSTVGSGQFGNRGYSTDGQAGVRNPNVNWSEARTLPAGTNIVVRTDQAIDSTSASEGQTYPATLAQDIADNSGNVIAPRGSRAELVVSQVSGGGTTGSPDLMLDLQSIEIGNRRYLVSSNSVSQGNQQGLGKNKRTAEMVGGGAILGTLLGAVAGGGKGAAIGAVAGAAAGAGVQVLTRGKEIKVPAETELTFQISQPVNLVPARS
jgi:hypothetical protein